MAHRMTSIGLRSALLAMAVVGGSLIAAANAQDSTPATSAPPGQEPVRSSEKTEYRRIDADLPLRPVSQLLAEIQRDYKVSAVLWGSNNGRTIAPTIMVKGVPGSVNDAMKAIDAAIADTSRWEVSKREIELTPVSDQSDIPVSEVTRLLRNARNDQGVDVVLIGAPGEASGFPVRLRLTGKAEAVDKMEAHIKEIIADEKTWRELRERQEAESNVTIDFPGGTVEEFVNAVIGKFNFVPPIYQDESFRKLAMRPVKTRLLDIPSALDLLSRVPPLDTNGASVPLRATFGNIDPQVMASGRRSDGLPLQLSRAVMVIDRAEPTRVDRAPARRAAFSLGEEPPKRELLDATLDVLAVAINLEEPSKTFRAKFHAPSNILVVQGTPDELAVAGQIVKARFPKAKVELPSEPKI